MVSLEILKKFSEAFGPSSAEDTIRSVIKDTLKDVCEFVTTPHGNLIAYHPEAKGRNTIIFQAHMDELGFRPYRYMPDGFIELSPASPIPASASNQMIVFYPGEILGILAITKTDHGQRYFLDVGAHNAKEAQEMVPYYANGAYLSRLREAPNFLCGKSFDDRAGCALIAHLMREELLCGNQLVGIFTVREESGNWPIPEIRKALDALSIKPQFIMNLEICPGGPTPLESDPMAIVGQGVTLVHMDRYYISSSKICQYMISLAEKEKVKFQQMAERSGGGELGSLCHELGIEGYSFVIPGRYMHSPNSVISRSDYEATLQMVKAVARSKDLDSILN